MIKSSNFFRCSVYIVSYINQLLFESTKSFSLTVRWLFIETDMLQKSIFWRVFFFKTESKDRLFCACFDLFWHLKKEHRSHRNVDIYLFIIVSNYFELFWCESKKAHRTVQNKNVTVQDLTNMDKDWLNVSIKFRPVIL